MPPVPALRGAPPATQQPNGMPLRVRAYDEANKARDTDPRLQKWIERRQAASRDRQKYEHIWHLCQSFAMGHQWVGWDKTNKRVVEMKNPDDRVRHTADIIGRHLSTQQGKIILDDAMPDITFRRDDVESEMFANQSRRAFQYGWTEEFEADEAYWRASNKRLTYGIAAVRVRHDPTWGAKHYTALHPNGDPVTDEEELQALAQTGMLPDGSLPMFGEIREGRVKWEVLGPFNILAPPGVEHENDFPWLIIERPIPLNTIREMYGEEVAAALQPENIRPVDTTGNKMSGGNLKDHANVYTGFEMPCPDYPDGHVTIWAQDKFLGEEEELPIKLAGQYHHGIRFLKYRQVEGRFWPVGLVQPLVGIQQQRNRTRSLAVEIIERGGFPWIMAHKNVITEKNKLDGIPFKVMELQPGSEFPQPVAGVGPGSWIREEVEMNDLDAMQATGTGDASLSQAPPSVSAFAHFAALVEQDDRRIGPIRKSDRKQLSWLAKYSLSLMRRYWMPGKEIAVAGEDGLMDNFVYNAAQLPDAIYVDFTESAPLPHSQAAEAQLTFDVYDRSIAGGQTLPLDWLVDSFKQGKMQPLPKREMKVQQDVAEMENLLIAQGRVDLVMVQPWHNDQLHVHYHRACQTAYASIPGYEQVVQMLELHIQQHLMSAEAKAQQAPPSNNGQQPQPGQGQGGQNAGMGPGTATLQQGAGMNQG